MFTDDGTRIDVNLQDAPTAGSPRSSIVGTGLTPRRRLTLLADRQVERTRKSVAKINGPYAARWNAHVKVSSVRGR